MTKGTAAILALVGGVWVVQGFGLAATGSFMDRSPFWGWTGVIMVLAALWIFLRKTRPR